MVCEILAFAAWSSQCCMIPLFECTTIHSSSPLLADNQDCSPLFANIVQNMPKAHTHTTLHIDPCKQALFPWSRSPAVGLPIKRMLILRCRQPLGLFSPVTAWPCGRVVPLSSSLSLAQDLVLRSHSNSLNILPLLPQLSLQDRPVSFLKGLAWEWLCFLTSEWIKEIFRDFNLCLSPKVSHY